MPKIAFLCLAAFFALSFFSCKKNKLVADSTGDIRVSQDSVLFDTVFTSIGSSTRNIRIRNLNSRRISISSIALEGGGSSQFIINVDGSRGTSFSDIEIAPNDSIYIFIQVNVNPNNASSPLIISDAIHFSVNGNTQKVVLEAWGQDAYYHRPNAFIKFKDDTYFQYSIVDSLPGSFTYGANGPHDIIWKNDKPHVIYSYCVVDSGEKLTVPAGTRVYLNNKAGIWVFQGGQIQVLGQKGNEVIFQGARRERPFTTYGVLKDYTDEPGQWDRIWINEGSDNNIIDYAIIKNGYIGVQAELLGDQFGSAGQLNITNTKIQNMSMWGLYSVAYKIYSGNNVISNCQENSVNITLGGAYEFINCTFANYWSKDKAREKPTINLNNHTETQVLPVNIHFGNCIVDGKLENEIGIDLKNDTQYPPVYDFSNCWLKTNINTSNTTNYFNNRFGGKDDVLAYKDIATYNFEPAANEVRYKNFVSTKATTDANKFKKDINGNTRNVSSVTAGAYEIQ